MFTCYQWKKGAKILKTTIFEFIENEGDSLPGNINLFDIMVNVRVIVFNATFNNISVRSRRSVLLVEENGVPRKKTPTCPKSLINFTTWCAYFFLSWVRNKLEQFFKREDKNMKLQGLSVTDWISDNWVWKCWAAEYLSSNISRTKLCIYKFY